MKTSDNRQIFYSEVKIWLITDIYIKLRLKILQT